MTESEKKQAFEFLISGIGITRDELDAELNAMKGLLNEPKFDVEAMRQRVQAISNKISSPSMKKRD